MRIDSISPILLLAAGVFAACRSGGSGAASDPAPLPPPVPVTVIPSPPIVHPITVCLVEDGVLREVPMTYDSATGDTLRDGRPLHGNEPTSTSYAAGAPWFIENELITLGEDRYLKYGTTRVVASHELSKVGEYWGVPLFAELGAARPPGIMFVPVRPGCEFQPYVRELRLRGVRGE